ncbi:MAG: autotransporter translocation and assembly module inner membrane component TamB [Roseibaca calidilacus]|uniref:Autotransporter secretion inner membrane protein TamB n=1 Tax=Roseibaca calidilacus TaxID=1666912 RepID=A0A0P7YQ08_9RHOB|nr:translocation/assembly module TamB domain-containing protein [Roseibaca calidilacus]KPP91003.1 MAG: autotransporter translocation and assembly module inner membrane component TamB [Roseibaca calidilacus]CUX83956.1 autotransporter secretion inner membrane protein TamB [Roseibaca calidilacus]
MRRWILAACAVLGLSFAALAQDAVVPEAGESDVGFLTRILQNSLSDRGREVRIRGFAGALSSRATFDEMTIADDEGVWLRISDAALQWNRAALFQRRIEISEISAARVEVLRAPVAAPSEELVPMRRFELPDLPVSVELGSLSLAEVSLAPELLGQPIRAGVRGRADLAGGAGSANLTLDRLDAVEGRFELDTTFSNETRELSLVLDTTEAPGGIAVSKLGVPGRPSARLRIAGDGPIEDFAADIELATDDTPRVEGRFALQTAQPGVQQAVSLDLSGDLRPLLQEAYHPFFGAESTLRTNARRFDDGRVSLDTLMVRTQTLNVEGRARIGAKGLPELIDLRGTLADPEGGRVLLPVAGADTSVQSAYLQLAFDAERSEDWDLVLDLTEFDNGDVSVEALFVNGLGRITSQAFGEDRDTVDALVDFTSMGVSARDPNLAAALGRSVTGSVALIWRDGQPFLLPGFLLEGRDYLLQGRARLDDGVIDGDIRAEYTDIARLSGLAGRDLSGALSARLDGRWGPERDRFDLTARLDGEDLGLDQPQADALLAGASAITLDMGGTDGQVTLRELRAQAQNLTMDVSGQLAQAGLDLSGRLDFPDLSVLGAQYGGRVMADLAVSGPVEQAAVTLSADANELALGQPDLDRALRGDTRLTLLGQRNGAGFDLAEFQVENRALTAQMQGRVDPGASVLDGRFALPDLALVRPGFGGAVSGTLGLLEEGESRRLTLDAETRNLAFGGQATDRLLAGRHVVQARAQVTPDAVLLERLSIDGPALFARVAGQLRDGRPDLTLEARLADMDYVAPGITGALSLGGTARDTGRAYALDLSANGPAGLSARVNGSVTKALQANLAISGTTDVALINPRIEPRSVRGPAQFDIALQGPLALSSASGTATLDGVSVVDPRNGVRLSDVQARADLTGGQAQIDLTGQSAQGGRLALGGSINLAPPLDSSLRARLDALRIIDPQLFEATVSGDLEITGPLARGPDLGGRLRLDSMELRIPRVGLTGPAYVPPGIEHLGESGAAQTTRARAGIFQGETNGRQRNPSRLDLSIDAPNRIFIRGRGLDAELGGTLRLTGTTADLIPIGQFNLIRGRLDLLGNRFALNEGFASLQGDFMPFVRLIASTEREGVSARVVLQGRANAPELLFESSPELPQEEIVSLLLFGRGFETLSLFQAAQLASSLATLSGQSEGILEKLRRNVGLDDLDVRTNEEGEATVRVGRYLTENVYTDLEVNPQGDSEASINIDLSPSLTARGQVDNAGRSSVGVFFERDY